MVETFGAKALVKDRVEGTCIEQELLLACSRTSVDPEAAERIRCLVKEDVDWEYLGQTASTHGVMPLLYQSLESVCPHDVPQATLDQFRVEFYTNSHHSQLMTRELLAVLDLLQEHKIPAIPFKGPVLAEAVYGNIALRQFADLDILVHQCDVLRARDLLIAQGYQPISRVANAKEAEHLLHCGHQYVLMRDSGKVVVELQWRFAHRYFPFPLDFDRLWERLEQVSVNGATVSHFCAEDLLLVLCVHGSKHCWERLEWVCDVAELARAHQGMDWERVTEQAGALGSGRMLLLGLSLARNLLGATIPESVFERIQRDKTVKLLANQVREHLFSDVDRSPGVFGEFLFHLKARERLRDRVSYCVRRATTPNLREYKLLPLPPYLQFLYFLLRPLLLAEEYLLKPYRRRLVRRLRTEKARSSEPIARVMLNGRGIGKPEDVDDGRAGKC